jgi:uncharacterized protein (TIGR02118 family)
MQRVVIYLKRRTDLPQPPFFDWWLGQHRALAERLPGLRRYIISLAADAQECPFDGMAELWFDDLAAADAAFASPAGQAARADAGAHVARLATNGGLPLLWMSGPFGVRANAVAPGSFRDTVGEEGRGRWRSVTPTPLVTFSLRGGRRCQTPR